MQKPVPDFDRVHILLNCEGITSWLNKVSLGSKKKKIDRRSQYLISTACTYYSILKGRNDLLFERDNGMAEPDLT